MKSATILQLGASALLATAQPSLHKRHEQLHKKRAQVTNAQVVTEVVNVALYIYQDQDGNPTSTSTSLSTSHVTIAAATPAAAETVSEAPAPPATTTAAAAAAVIVSSEVATPKAATSSPKASSVPSYSGGSGIDFGGNGVTYSPYQGTPGSVSCKSESQLTSDILELAAMAAVIRLYDVGEDECGMARIAIAALKSNSQLKTRLMFSMPTFSRWEQDLSELIAAASGHWEYVHSVAVANEAIPQGQASVSQVCAAVVTGRQELRAAGYNGPVLAIDTQATLVNNPDLIEVSDVIGANIHAYFTPTCQPSGAGAEVQAQVDNLKAIAGGKTVLVTESGWPHAGGDSRTTPEAQAQAMASIKASFPANLAFFTAFDDKWKSGPAIEQNFGCLGAIKSLF